ncbi:MAG: flagellar biosynthetic protein FliR [Chloroflexi bacterium]|nr:flagellar biosynthetic protein FliR [Chloroflexota bacterium]
MPTAAPSYDLLAFSSAYVSYYILAAVRVLAALMFNPLLGSARVPMPARIGLGLFATLVLFPMSGPLNGPAGGPPVEPVAIGPLAIAGEALIGLLAGFAVTLIFGGVQFAAGLIGINSGFSFAQTLNPIFDHGGGVIETFFSAFALLVFVEINGHHLFLMGLAQLFEAVPVGQVGRLPGSTEALIALSGALFSAGVKLALPVLAALLLADLAFGLLARVAPQFNLFALELPAKMLVGLAALAIALPIVLPRLTALFRTVPTSMLTLAG